jgi:zinc transport system substrate-binding protein
MLAAPSTAPAARRRLAFGALAAAASTLLAGCGSSASPSAEPGAAVSVVASFYPLEFAVSQVGGDPVRVTSLTKPGAEPHELELRAKDVAAVSKSELVVYAKGFQPAVDTAVDQEAGDHALDVTQVASLDLPALPEDDSRVGGVLTAAEGRNSDAPADPHFWLDPQRYAAVGTAIARRLQSLDPADAEAYSRNAAAFTDRLTVLDEEFRTGLASCRSTELVTSHAAFGYLAERYGLTQVAVTGLSPDAEPSPARLAAVADYVRQHHITTIYAETLVEPAFAETVAQSTGARVATLDPLEGLTDSSAGHDYFEVMRSNLATLRTGQGCA